jgi:hypothetical protein
MTALLQDRKTDKLGTEGDVYPITLKFPVEANTSIFGALVAINAAGNAVPATANPALKCVGRCERACLNLAVGGTISPDGIATGAAGSLKVGVRQGVYYFNINADSTITIANFGGNVFASDDNTVSLSDAGGTRPYVGSIVDPAGDMAPTPLSTQVGVFIGLANPYAANPLQAGGSTANKARAQVTSLQAYTGTGTNILTETANGAWAAQDGVTNVVGDVVFIPAGTTNLVGALDSGPWSITSLGSAGTKWVLTRPDWFVTGSTVVQAMNIDLGGEGTTSAGNVWKSFAAPGQIVGTNDPLFFPRFQIFTTAAMTAGVTSPAVSVLFIRALAQFSPIPVTPGGTQGTLRISASTPGYPGASSVTVTSSSNTDTSTVKLQVENF